MALGPIFRWLYDGIILLGPLFLRVLASSCLCLDADDIALAAPHSDRSCRSLLFILYSSLDHWHKPQPQKNACWEKDFLVPSMALRTADALHIVCRLDRDDTFDEVPQNRKQKVATGLLLDKLHKKTLLGLYLVVPREPWDRSVVIVLLTFCTT